MIVTQGLCRVCAVGLDDLRAAVARPAAKADMRLVSPHPRRLGDILGIAQPGVQSLGDGRQARLEGPERDRLVNHGEGDRSAQLVKCGPLGPHPASLSCAPAGSASVLARSRDVGFVIM
jgi:hypothetical protein